MTRARVAQITVVALAALLVGAPAARSAEPSAADYKCEGLKATIVGTQKPDVIEGTEGRDVIVALNGDDLISGLGGDDVVCAGEGADQLRGGTGNDRLLGEGNHDGPRGEHHGDHFWGDPGDDFIDGGDDKGYDYLHFNDAPTGITVDRAAETVTGGYTGTDIYTRIGVVYASPFDDILIDDDRDGIFYAGAGDDVIESGGGYNYILGENGNDTITDTGLGQLSGGNGDDVLTGPYILFGDAGNDRLTGTGAYDKLDGGDGNDEIYGGSRVDFIKGGSGDDLLVGGQDGGYNDEGDGGDGTDVCVSIEIMVSCELSSQPPSTNPKAAGQDLTAG